MFLKNKHIILTFHGIGEYKKKLETGEEKVWISKNDFIDICKFVTNRDDIIITFDDGNISDIEIAVPELMKNNLKGIFFVVAGRIGETNYLNSDQLITMKQNGMTIGSHGMYHRSWRSLSDKELIVELFDARKIIEEMIGEEIYSVSCPFGTYNGRIIQKIKFYGYEHLFTSDGGITDRNNFLQHRNTIHYNDDILTLLKQPKYNSKTLWRDFKSFIKTKCL